MCSVRAHGVSCFRMINRVLPRLWLGRALALSGILLVAANLRSAVAALSPIVSYIRKDFDLDIFAVGAIGMLPPFFFAVFSSVRPASLAMWSILALVAVIPWIWLIVARPAGPPSAQDNIRSIKRALLPYPWVEFRRGWLRSHRLVPIPFGEFEPESVANSGEGLSM